MQTRKPSIVIVTPAKAGANNGNSQTASRWKNLLFSDFAVSITNSWPDEKLFKSAFQPDLMIALHAKKSYHAIERWNSPKRLILILTGTDLYRDIHEDPQAKRALAMAERLVTLQSLGLKQLPVEFHSKTRVVYQSCSSRKPLDKTHRHLKVVMVGHLREEKCPETFMQAAQQCAGLPIQFTHIGRALDPAYQTLAEQTAQANPHYTWLGNQSHETVRRKIQQAHLLVHASKMEGGAHVIMEACRSGTAVLASRIDGNVGMLGEDYPGYFTLGSTPELVSLLEKIQAEVCSMKNMKNRLYDSLLNHCASQAPLFDPESERAALIAIIKEVLNPDAKR